MADGRGCAQPGAARPAGTDRGSGPGRQVRLGFGAERVLLRPGGLAVGAIAPLTPFWPFWPGRPFWPGMPLTALGAEIGLWRPVLTRIPVITATAEITPAGWATGRWALLSQGAPPGVSAGPRLATANDEDYPAV